MFTENKGQIIDTEGHLRPDILYKGQTYGTDVYLRKTGFSYVLSKSEENPSNEINNYTEKKELENLNIILHKIDVDFVGCNTNTQLENNSEVEGHSNFYYPHCSKGITYVKSFNEIIVKNIYNNINIRYYGGKENGLKYDIVVLPGGDPSQIKMKYTGAEEIVIKNGELRIKNSLNEITEILPKVYQNINGKIVDVKTKYILEGTTISFQLTTYNAQLPLIIDPWITYYGGSNWERCASIVTDANGDVVVTGNTFSTDFPTQNASQSAHGGGSWDGLVVKFTNLGARVFATYFGGNVGDFTKGVDVDNANNIYVTGGTDSPNLPTVNLAGAYNQAAFAGGTSLAGADAFIAQYTPAGVITWLTYYGSTDNEEGYDIALDNANNIFLVGVTYSTTLPTLSPYQAANGGSGDGFVTKFSSAGALTWGTYYGGNDFDLVNAINIDPTGNVIIGGITNSSNFPIVSAHQNTIGSAGSADGFVAKLSNATGTPSWSTFYGDVGFGGDVIYTATTDGTGNVYAGGRTSSAANIATTGSFQPAKNGSYDAFIVKFNSGGVRQWATYMGGAAGLQEYVTGLACDSYNNLIVSGDTYCSDFPVTTCAYQTTWAPSECQFFAVFYSNGNRLCSGMLGISGGGDKETFEGLGGSLALHGCHLFMNAMSNCAYPVFGNAFQSTCGGQIDLSVSKLFIYNCGGRSQNIPDFSSRTTVCKNDPVIFTPTYSSCDTSGLQYTWTFSGGTPTTSTSANPTITYTASGNFNVELIITGHCSNDTVLKPGYITVTNNSSFTSTVTPSAGITCYGNSTASAGVNSTTGSPLTYNWSNGQTTQTVSNLPAAIYTVTVTDNNNCISIDTVIFSQPPALAISQTITDAGCTASTGVITTTITGGTSAYTYNWSNSQTTQTVSNLPAGNYTLTVTDANSCSFDTIMIVNAIGAGTMSVTSTDPLCNGITSGTATASIAGGSSPFTYSWSGGQTDQSISNLGAGIYTVTITDDSGCITIDSVTISEPVALNINMSPSNSICIGFNTILSAAGQGGASGYNYLWNTSNTNASITEQPTLTTIYSITVTDANGCTKDSSITITVTTPTVDAGLGTTILSGQSTSLSSSGNGTFNWQPATSCTCANPTVSPTKTTTYTLTITLGSCSVFDTVTVYVIIDECDENDVFVPNGFSPNNDGENDVLKLFLSGTPEVLYFAIYDRWGEKVFETTDFKETWNGFYRGKLMNAAVYSYILKINCSATNVGTIKTGNISLVR